jgi:hypothetical protein
VGDNPFSGPFYQIRKQEKIGVTFFPLPKTGNPDLKRWNLAAKIKRKT